VPPPLNGIKVVDFTRVIAGPVAALILSDLGAEVVKLEHPEGGDDTRGYRPPDYKGLSPAFLAYNRGKQSVAIDLQKSSGLATARGLIKEADIVIENFSTGVMTKYGLDYDSVRRPELIYISTSAYGRDGPFAQQPGYDPVVQAESGYQSLTGHPEHEPVRTAIPMTDVTTGLNGALAALAALWRRKKTGLGQFVEAPLYDTGAFNTLPLAIQRMLGGQNPTRLGNADHWIAPSNSYIASDGELVVLTAADNKQFKALFSLIDRHDIVGTSDYLTAVGRLNNRDKLDKAVQAAIATAPAADWVTRLREVGVPVALLRETPEAIESKETKRRGLTGRAPHPILDDAPELGPPFRLKYRGTKPAQGAPTLGQDTDKVLKRWLGYSEAQIAEINGTDNLS
jgi:crotonobetainyl-CoA:carnitine CoA-transferase CaiB-like acyl-CoA transferase